MATRIGLITALLALGGCCLSVISGSTGGSEPSAGGTAGITTSGGTSGGATTLGGGSTTGASTATSTGGVIQHCGPAANLSNTASYTFLPLDLLVSADLNGDGLLDLIATRGINADTDPPTLAATPGLEVFLAQSDGGLSAAVEYLETDSKAVAVGDVNGDGRPDVVTSNQTAIQIFLNDGYGGLTPSPPIDLEGVYGEIYQIAVADFNGDGLGDLLVAGSTSDGLEVALLLASAPATFGAPGVIPGVGVRNGVNPEVVFLVADLNQDGLPDIAATTTDGSDLAILLNQRDGGFGETLYPTPTITQLAIVPRGAMAPDIVFALFAIPGVGGLQVLKNSGAGMFSVGPLYPVYGGWLTVGDFNGDCIPDIAIDQGSICPNGNTSTVSVLYGDDDGNFGAPVSLEVTEHVAYGMASLGSVTSPRAFAVADACGTGVTVYGDPSKE